MAAEHFAIAADVYRWLERIDDGDYTCETPDGRGRGRAEAGARLARVVCANLDYLNADAITAIAEHVARMQVRQIAGGIRQVMRRLGSACPRLAVLAGQGAFVARAAAEELGLTIHDLSERDRTRSGTGDAGGRGGISAGRRSRCLTETRGQAESVARRGRSAMISGQEGLERLRQGNQRFVSGVRSSDMLASQTRRIELASGQEPFAIILGCSDSRVPAEIVFDQGLGDLFVIRVAGNIVAPSQIGSVEFAAERAGARLVVVLGHSKCGAILATLEELQRPTENHSTQSALDRRPGAAVRGSVAGDGPEVRPDELVRQAVRANVRASANQLRHGSDIVEELIQNDGLCVVGAEYSLETGVVEFFDGVREVM